MYFLIVKILGITFGIKLMERGEEKAQITYEMSAKSGAISQTCRGIDARANEGFL
jgi:hypothetical protein